MARLRKWLPWLLGLLVLASVATYYALTEPVTTVYRSAPHSSIVRNPFHAAQAWLGQRQQPSKRILSAAGLFPLPDTNHVLIFDKRRGLMTDYQINTLLHWVEAGGELIVAARPLPESRNPFTASPRQWHDNDPLLYPLGITVWNSEPQDTFQTLEEDPLIAVLAMMPAFAGHPLQYCLFSDNGTLREGCVSLLCDAPAQPAPLLLHSDASDQPRQIQLYNDHLLWHDSWDEEEGLAPHRQWPTQVVGWADNDQGSQLLQLSLGNGQITVLADLGLWDNQHLLYFDHAWLLGWLTGSNPVWFVRSVEMPPLPQWLWRQAPQLIFALLLLLALWMWLRIPRQGPLQPVHEDRHHDYLQHLHASGYFQWRTGQPDALLDALRQQARSRLAAMHSEADQAINLAATRLSTPPASLRQALNHTPESREQLVQYVQLLQTLRSNT